MNRRGPRSQAPHQLHAKDGFEKLARDLALAVAFSPTTLHITSLFCSENGVGRCHSGPCIDSSVASYAASSSVLKIKHVVRDSIPLMSPVFLVDSVGETGQDQ